MKTSHRGFISPLLLALIALILIGGGAYVYVQNKQANQSVTATSTAQTSAPQTKSTETLVDGLYNNEKYGFQFQVPNTWQLMPAKLTSPMALSSTIQSSDLNQVIYGEANAKWGLIQGALIHIDVSKPITLRDFEPSASGKIIKVAGEDALIDSSISNGDITERTYWLNFHHNGLDIYVTVEYKGLDGQKFFDNLLSTFKFTN